MPLQPKVVAASLAYFGGLASVLWGVLSSARSAAHGWIWFPIGAGMVVVAMALAGRGGSRDEAPPPARR